MWWPKPSPKRCRPTARQDPDLAARDDHADLLVKKLGDALEDQYGPHPHDLVLKITARGDQPGRRDQALRNDPHPKYVVTVDLLTTGVDIPTICTLVFVRRSTAGCSNDQMIGRRHGARPHRQGGFRILDAVDIYANLQSVTDMRPVIWTPR